MRYERVNQGREDEVEGEWGLLWVGRKRWHVEDVEGEHDTNLTYLQPARTLSFAFNHLAVNKVQFAYAAVPSDASLLLTCYVAAQEEIGTQFSSRICRVHQLSRQCDRNRIVHIPLDLQSF